MSTTVRALVLASSVTAWAVSDAHATEYQCQRQDSSLRIAIEVKKAGHTLPCEVVAEDDRGERAILYSAQYDREYCPSRIEKTRDELELEGWSCEKTLNDNVVYDEETEPEAVDLVSQSEPPDAEDTEDNTAFVEVTDADRVVTASHQCRLDDQQRHIRIDVENPASGKPCELIYWEDGDQTKPGERLWRAEHDATFCPTRLNVIVDKWVSEGWQCDSEGLQTVAVDLDTPDEPEAAADETLAAPSETIDEAAGDDLSISDPELEAIIAADAERIGEWMEVEPAIEVAARGDLNEDGTDDAVVFLAYQSDQAAYRQYMMSYLVNGEGYQLASVKLLTGVNPPPAQARVEHIAEGVIWLTLPGESGSTPAQTGYRLRDQQLVEVNPDVPADDSEN